MATPKKSGVSVTSARLTLAANLEALRKHYGVSGRQFAGELYMNVPAETGRRALRALKAIDVDTLDDIARGLHLEPWQLLIPGLDPKNLPTYVPSSVSTSIDELLSRITAAKTTP